MMDARERARFTWPYDAQERARLEAAWNQRRAAGMLTTNERAECAAIAAKLEREAALLARQEAARGPKLCWLVRPSEGFGYDPERQLLEPIRARVLWEERGEP